MSDAKPNLEQIVEEIEGAMAVEDSEDVLRRHWPALKAALAATGASDRDRADAEQWRALIAKASAGLTGKTVRWEDLRVEMLAPAPSSPAAAGATEAGDEPRWIAVNETFSKCSKCGQWEPADDRDKRAGHRNACWYAPSSPAADGTDPLEAKLIQLMEAWVDVYSDLEDIPKAERSPLVAGAIEVARQNSIGADWALRKYREKRRAPPSSPAAAKLADNAIAYFRAQMEFGNPGGMTDVREIITREIESALSASQARVGELERELQAAHGECAVAYEVIDSLPDFVLERIPSAKLLAAVRTMEAREKQDMAETTLQRRVSALEKARDGYRDLLQPWQDAAARHAQQQAEILGLREGIAAAESRAVGLQALADGLEARLVAIDRWEEKSKASMDMEQVEMIERTALEQGRRADALEKERDAALARAETAEGRAKDATTAKGSAYSERDRLVCALSKLFPAWLERHPDSDTTWENDWRWIVFVEIPTKDPTVFGDARNHLGPCYQERAQLSWHIHDSELAWFNHLERRASASWDGHTTEEKYRRLAALRTLQDDKTALARIMGKLAIVRTEIKSEREHPKEPRGIPTGIYSPCSKCGKDREMLVGVEMPSECADCSGASAALRPPVAGGGDKEHKE